MYYQISTEIKQIGFSEIDPDKITVGLISLEELERNYKYFGFANSTVLECKSDRIHLHGNIDVYDDYHFGIINGIDSEHILKLQDRIAIYIKRNLFIIVIIEDADDSVAEKLSKAMERLNPKKLTLERVIYGFLERLIADDYDAIEVLEETISGLEEEISKKQLNDDFPAKITSIRKRLLVTHNFYEQLTLLGMALQENENDLFLEDKLRYFTIFTNRVSSLNSNIQMLQDYCAHVKEAYHAQLDNNLNAVMEVFTVVAAVFLPLTLIVGWYGMNFKYMPELSWKFGYLFVIILAIVVVTIALRYFKKKKFF